MYVLHQWYAGKGLIISFPRKKKISNTLHECKFVMDKRYAVHNLQIIIYNTLYCKFHIASRFSWYDWTDFCWTLISVAKLWLQLNHNLTNGTVSQTNIFPHKVNIITLIYDLLLKKFGRDICIFVCIYLTFAQTTSITLNPLSALVPCMSELHLSISDVNHFFIELDSSS